MLHGRALRYIDEVARQGSIRKAARTLHVAASAVNRYILELEEELQAPIFERLPRGLKLTSSGEILIQHIRETLQAHQRMRSQIQSLKGLNRGEVALATMATLAAGRIAEIVAAYREEHPQVSLRIMVGDRTTVAEMVALGQADIAIAYNLPDDTRLQRAAEFHHALGAVVAPAHPLANRRTVRMSDCLLYPLVLADRSLSLREVVEATAPARATLVPVVETNSMELMKRLARTTPHITFLNRLDVDREMATGDLVFIPLTGTGSLQRLNILHRARGSLSPAGSHFMQFAQERLLASFDEN
ncbi:DNA-binding transcriptional LysR family regulator [Rhizobium sp. BK226]|nr:ORF1; high similarity to members of the LysR family [Rhizobium leguminosarum bv. trifolii]KZS50270.1 LysR family transcriptional regulator [Rhizobium anhuiense bv. trifolii]MBB3742706.1 DNA-binding transcriptional LysR family regulator [Rhizobium sp. BK591]MBB4112375.1 DNA-binding transcriptional LysR family regulator [Rhizobium sp. BK226]MBB4213205.1 DNA-binding transcriptional LysR family regulator [Rhizobium sp. BK212]GGD72292.1 transcriptional regulator [Rhizobium anhuiense]